jgi:hypothetical protein
MAASNTETPNMRRRIWLVVVLIGLFALPPTAQWFFGRGMGIPPAVPYNGQFTLARLWYPQYPGWSYDWPDMEQNLGLILNEITAIRANPRAHTGNIFRMDDPDLLKFPIAYLSEPGYWFPNDSEATALRTYIAKGGFLIVDDFHFSDEWAVFERAMRMVLPNGRIDRLDVSHPVFNSFFHIKTLQVPYPGELGQQGLMGEFFGIHEDNDSTKRLIVVINYNMDIGDYMEWSATGRYLVAPSNEAYKFGINYLIYGLTH